ncbi:STN domain-containing protein, partial [Streptomyces sp. NPDC058107]
MVALTLGTPGLVHAQAANTDNKTVALSIAAQPLSAALHELSAATGTAIGFSPALVAGKTAHAAKGTLTVQQAIDQLLLGTALIAVWEGDSIIVKAESAST